MAEDNIVQKIKRWKPMSKRPTGRPKTRWEDDVLEDIKSINISNWKKAAQNRDSWQECGWASQNFIQVVAIYKKKHNNKYFSCMYQIPLIMHQLNSIKGQNWHPHTNVKYWFPCYCMFIHSLVFSLRGWAGRNQSPVMWPVWLWHAASWASSWG